jgi:hypothetical protein
MICDSTTHDAPLSLEKLALLTTKFGDNWATAERIEAKEGYSFCESCDQHPMSEAQAERTRQLLDKIKALGGGTPIYVYVHCEENVFIEWIEMKEDEKGWKDRMVVDFRPNKPIDVMYASFGPEGKMKYDHWVLEEQS